MSVFFFSGCGCDISLFVAIWPRPLETATVSHETFFVFLLFSAHGLYLFSGSWGILLLHLTPVVVFVAICHRCRTHVPQNKRGREKENKEQHLEVQLLVILAATKTAYKKSEILIDAL